MIHIIDDEEDIRLAVAEFLVTTGYRCQTYASVEEYLSQDHGGTPGCVILDVMLGHGTDGIDAIPSLHSATPNVPIVIMTAHGDITMAVRALQMGAIDFLEKPFGMDRLVEALTRVLERQRTRLEAQQRAAPLTKREREVMRALSRGLANKEVAAEIGISPRTVEVYRAAIMTKLQLQTFADLVRLAVLLDEVSP